MSNPLELGQFWGDTAPVGQGGTSSSDHDVGIKPEHFPPQLEVEAGHHRNHQDQDRDSEGHTKDRDHRNNRYKSPLRLQKSKG